MLARKSEGLKEFNPLRMPCIQLVLAINERQSLVIQMEYKRLRLEIMTPTLQSPYNGIEILITSEVVEPFNFLRK